MPTGQIHHSLGYKDSSAFGSQLAGHHPLVLWSPFAPPIRVLGFGLTKSSLSDNNDRIHTLNLPSQAAAKNAERGQMMERCTLHFSEPQVMVRSEYLEECNST